MLVLLVFFVCIFFLVRSILVFIGLLKDPILEACEQYGPMEYLYIPILPIVTWFGLVVLALGGWLWAMLRVPSPLLIPGLFIILVACFGYRYYETLAAWHYRWLKYPRWFFDLREYTTRYERRRIAYAWDRLPWRLRLAYNSNSEAFRVWTDFVVMSTVWEVEEGEEHLWYERP